jgi:hypothetical protein
MAQLSDLLTFCKQQARIESRDYIDPWSRGELRNQQLSAWRRDCRLRDSARKACLQAFPGRLKSATEPLVPGRYGNSGRLEVSPDGEIDYTPCVYSPREIYSALLRYLEETN